MFSYAQKKAFERPFLEATIGKGSLRMKLEPGDHLSWLYSTDEEYRTLENYFIQQGLKQGEKVIAIGDDYPNNTTPHNDYHDEFTVTPSIEGGQLRFYGADEIFIRRAHFDPQNIIELLSEEADKALLEGYRCLRVIEKMHWIREDSQALEHLIEYESKLNDFLSEQKCLIVCEYDMRRFKSEILMDILFAHPLCVVGTEIYDNPHYVQPSEIRDDDIAAAKLRCLLDSLVQHKRADQALSTLAGGIAHNFNNLNMGIQGNASLMLFDTESSHPNYERLRTIEKLVQKEAILTNQLLGYAGEGGYELKRISLNDLVEEAFSGFDQAKGEIRIHLNLSDDLSLITADTRQIEQILLNLYVNSVDAMPNGGDFFLETSNLTHEDMKGKPYKPRPGDYVLLSVRDTGMGMNQDTINQIFEPFFTTKDSNKNMGLGLASVYGIIKAQNGYVDVDSTTGEGTVFKIYLPAFEKEAPRQGQSDMIFLRHAELTPFMDHDDMIPDPTERILKNAAV